MGNRQEQSFSTVERDDELVRPSVTGQMLQCTAGLLPSQKGQDTPRSGPRCRVNSYRLLG